MQMLPRYSLVILLSSQYLTDKKVHQVFMELLKQVRKSNVPLAQTKLAPIQFPLFK